MYHTVSLYRHKMTICMSIYVECRCRCEMAEAKHRQDIEAEAKDGAVGYLVT